MVTLKQILIVDIQKVMRKHLNITLKSSNYKGREQEEKKGTESNYSNNQKTMSKMAINTYL